MNYKMIANLIGRILVLEAAFLLPAAGISLYYQETKSCQAIVISAVVTALFGVALMFIKAKNKNFYAREGYISAALVWIVMSLFGALPFFLSAEIPSYIDCVFETISGFTTTGASILSNVETLSKGLLYWRSFTHWVGGMGVLVFVLALQPMSRGSGQDVHLLRAESPGPVVEKLTPKMHQSAKILYGIYIGMTLLQILLLLLGKMPVFDAVTTAFGTAGTGGFGVRADSMASYSHYIQTVVTIFMALFGVNFIIYYYILLGKPSQIFRNEELRLYLFILLAATLLISFNTISFYHSFPEALHHSAFQVSSIMTTTGFATVDFNLWPQFSKCVLLLLMIVGASAGSTGGGIKVARLLLLGKYARCERKRIVSPREISLVRMDGKVVDDDIMREVNLYMISYFAVIAASFLLISLDNFDIETTISSVLACLNNIGPGLGLAGPMSCYEGFSNFSKLVLCINMLVGRLEIFPFLTLLAPSAWERK